MSWIWTWPQWCFQKHPQRALPEAWCLKLFSPVFFHKSCLPPGSSASVGSENWTLSFSTWVLGNHSPWHCCVLSGQTRLMPGSQRKLKQKVFMIREVWDYLASVSRPRSTTAAPSTFTLWIAMSFHVCGAVMLSEELCGIRIFWWIRAFAFTSPLPASVVGERNHHQCVHILQCIWQKRLNNCSRWGQLIRERSGFMALWILPVTLKPSTNIREPCEGQGGVRVPLPGAIV